MARMLGRLDPTITVLIIEHDMDIALELARRGTVLHYGRVIADGPRERCAPTPRAGDLSRCLSCGRSTPTTARATSCRA